MKIPIEIIFYILDKISDISDIIRFSNVAKNQHVCEYANTRIKLEFEKSLEKISKIKYSCSEKSSKRITNINKMIIYNNYHYFTNRYTYKGNSIHIYKSRNKCYNLNDNADMNYEGSYL